MSTLTAYLWAFLLSLQFEELGFMTDYYSYYRLTGSKFWVITSFLMSASQRFSPMEKAGNDSIHLTSTGRYVAEYGTDGCEDVQQCFCPQGSYYLVPSVVPRPVESASCEDC